MSEKFCEHLQEYGALYARAEACEARCNELVARLLDGTPGDGAIGDLTAAVEAWLQVDRELRAALVELARQGRILLPKKKPHAVRRHGAPCCSECRRKIPRLKLSGWEVAANGVVAFQGRELFVGAVSLGAGG